MAISFETRRPPSDRALIRQGLQRERREIAKQI
jgi:hypothetical protein